ncbi:hypothetical protein VTK73DRAFT_5442 [Phialemonium thermophilum]|uniref:Uncharacterized protein n=1 Tax=Phialemonium thermophilum TaxID=223376 RepID=A0ABR3V1R6_9PEZI
MAWAVCRTARTAGSQRKRAKKSRSRAVELVLALEDGGVVVGGLDGVGVGGAVVGGRDAALDGGLEGVAEGAGQQVAGLQVDDAAVQAGDAVARGVGLEHGQVRLHLVGAVAQPHGVDVAGDDEGQLLVGVVGGDAAPPDGGVQGVGVGVLEEAVQVRVGDAGLHGAEQGLDVGRVEGAARRVRALVGELVATAAVGPVALLRVGRVVRAVCEGGGGQQGGGQQERRDEGADLHFFSFFFFLRLWKRGDVVGGNAGKMALPNERQKQGFCVPTAPLPPSRWGQAYQSPETHPRLGSISADLDLTHPRHDMPAVTSSPHAAPPTLSAERGHESPSHARSTR